MENKILSQELRLIEKLLQLVSSKGEFDLLVVRAKEILSHCVPTAHKSNPSFSFIFLSLLKGGDAKSAAKKMKRKITIKGEPVIDIYESFDGSYWYIVEILYTQDSLINGRVYKNDQILFGYARLSMYPAYAEFGNISETELNLLGNRIWKVPKSNWHLCPEVEITEVAEVSEGEIPSESINISYSNSLKGGDIKMKDGLQTTIDFYVELLDKIRVKTGGDADSLAILTEIRKDQRSQQMQERRVTNGNLPATENQIEYLRKLGAVIPVELTREKASQLIDEAKEKKAMQRAIEHPIRIP